MKRIIALSLLVLGAVLIGDRAEAKCFPVYGNWCGANYPHPATNPPPVDAFDDACRRHDICWAMTGGGTGCDLAFVQELHGLAWQYGYLPRPLQWAESLLRMRSGSMPMPWNMPLPSPGDMFGVMDMMGSDCGY